MTWIIGGNTIFGYCYAISDIRVTFGNRTERDCLQKFHIFNKSIGAGFAGSVKIGFQLLDDLNTFLKETTPEKAELPQWVAINWRRRARNIFNNAPLIEQKCLSHIIMLGQSSIENESVSILPQSHVIKFESPEFEPYFAKPTEVISIGSGAYVKEYISAINKISENPEFLNTQTLNQYGMATVATISITDIIRNKPVPGISMHLQNFTLSNNNLLWGNNDHKYTESGLLKEVKMPRIAASYQEFKAYCKSIGFSASAAIG